MSNDTALSNDTCGHITNDGTRCQKSGNKKDGKCYIHSDHEEVNMGAPSKFDDAKDDLLSNAEEYITTKQVAQGAGVSKQTLYNYIQMHDDFAEEFRRRRSQASQNLIQDALTGEVDSSFAKFLLQTSFDFIKTEEKLVDENHSKDNFDDGFTVDWE
jgi:hypothetical protein